MAYTTVNKSTDYFNTKLYTGTGSSNGVTGVGFQPDWVWIKCRDDSHNHQVFDVVRGVHKRLRTDTNGAETSSSESLKSFDSDGFTLGTQANVNNSSNTFAAWNWKAGGTGSANNDGSIATTVSVNTTAGFSIVKYDSTNTNGSTFGHGLGTTPGLIIIKNLDDAQNWLVYHKGLGTSKYLFLSTTAAEASTSTWIAVSNTTFTMNNTFASSNNGDNFIAYCFAEKTGYSKFGTYTGNGANDGAFVYTGFAPSVVIFKVTSTTNNWNIFDNKRPGYNLNTSRFFPNLSNAEQVGTAEIDLLSNGIKFRNTNDNYNGSATYSYIAFGQSLVGSNNVPATAR